MNVRARNDTVPAFATRLVGRDADEAHRREKWGGQEDCRFGNRGSQLFRLDGKGSGSISKNKRIELKACMPLWT